MSPSLLVSGCEVREGGGGWRCFHGVCVNRQGQLLVPKLSIIEALPPLPQCFNNVHTDDFVFMRFLAFRSGEGELSCDISPRYWVIGARRCGQAL